MLMLINTGVIPNMKLTINSSPWPDLFPDNSLTFGQFPEFNSLTFPGFPVFPEKWSYCFLLPTQQHTRTARTNTWQCERLNSGITTSIYLSLFQTTDTNQLCQRTLQLLPCSGNNHPSFSYRILYFLQRWPLQWDTCQGGPVYNTTPHANC